MSRLGISEILGQPVNTLTDDDKYSLRNSETLRRPSQMQLCQKLQKLSEFCMPFLKSRTDFENFEQKDGVHRLCFYEIIDCERRG